MINIILGRKGEGKTKIIIGTANACINRALGSVVYLDKDASHIYDLDRRIRLVNISDFPITSQDGFIGFIYGLLSADHDVSDIFFDGFYDISKSNIDNIENLFKVLDSISKNYKVDMTLSLSESMESLPEYIKQFVKVVI